jgi:hypothetical protein
MIICMLGCVDRTASFISVNCTIAWCVDLLLDTAHNTHPANNIGTVFSTSVDGLLLCHAHAVISHNSTW